MEIEDITKAKQEAEKFIALVDDWLIAEKQRSEDKECYLNCPAEI